MHVKVHSLEVLQGIPCKIIMTIMQLQRIALATGIFACFLLKVHQSCRSLMMLEIQGKRFQTLLRYTNFLNQIRYFSIKLATQLSSRGCVDPGPDLMHILKILEVLVIEPATS